jgi:hypothetical protein
MSRAKLSTLNFIFLYFLILKVLFHIISLVKPFLFAFFTKYFLTAIL